MEKQLPLFFSITKYILGLLLMATGSCMAMNSQLGVSPINTLPYVLSLICQLELGICIPLVFSTYIAVQLIILHKTFKWVNLAQIFFSALFGCFISLARYVFRDFVLPTVLGHIAMLTMSIVLIASGISLYTSAQLLPMPLDGMVAALTEKLNFKALHKVRITTDFLIMLAAAILSMLFLEGIYGVGIGTVLSILLVAPTRKVLQKSFSLLKAKLFKNFQKIPVNIYPVNMQQEEA